MSARELPLIARPTDPKDAFGTRISEAINKLLVGRGNNVGTFDLAASPATTTTVLNNRFESEMTVSLTPMTLAAATSDWYVSARASGSFTITHVPVLSTATFTYSFRG